MQTLPNYRLFGLLALAFIIGILISSFVDLKLDLLLIILIILALVFSAFVNRILKNSLFFIVSLGFIFVFVGASYYSHFTKRYFPLYEYGKEYSVAGKIVSDPSLNYKNQKAIIQIQFLNNQKMADNRQRVLLTLPRYPMYSYGQEIEFTSQIEKPGKIEDFDYGNYLKKDKIFGIVRNPKDFKAVEGNLKTKERAVKFLYVLSEKFQKSISSILPEPHASLANGVLLGAKQSISESLKESLKITGLSHITALSGYNITIIVILLSNLLLQYFPKRTIFMLSGFIIISFVILTGASSSVVRAAIFSLALLLGKLSGRMPDFLNLLLLPALIMLLINPFLLVYDIGFQLSFLAFAGLMYLSPVVRKIKERKLEWLPDNISSPLVETSSAQLAVFPLLLANFGCLSLIAPVSNLLVLWVVPYIMAMAFIGGMLGMMSSYLGKIAMPFLWTSIEYFLQVTAYFSKIPFASIGIKNGNFLIGLFLYVCLVSAWIFYIKRWKIKI